MLSISYLRIKSKAPKAATASGASLFIFHAACLRSFLLVRIFFQPERIGSVFNLRELRLILASIDFVGTKSQI